MTKLRFRQRVESLRSNVKMPVDSVVNSRLLCLYFIIRPRSLKGSACGLYRDSKDLYYPLNFKG